jgi:hypothetical protein
MLQFPYLAVRLKGSPPPSLPGDALIRWRPFVSVTLLGPTDRRTLTRALLDTGSDECIFPLHLLSAIGGTPLPSTKHFVTWRGNSMPIRHARISLMLTDDTSRYTWPATVAFSAAPIPYPLLGLAGCLQYFDARFLGADRNVELEAN